MVREKIQVFFGYEYFDFLKVRRQALKSDEKNFGPGPGSHDLFDSFLDVFGCPIASDFPLAFSRVPFVVCASHLYESSRRKCSSQSQQLCNPSHTDALLTRKAV